MRRRRERFLPIVLNALLVQILAPIGASWAMGRALSDPLNVSVVCATHVAASNAVGQGDQPAPQQNHDDCCTLCCLSSAGGSALGAPADSFASPFRSPRRVTWRDAATTLPSLAGGFHAQARAPPFMS